jgi:tetratricopeptide (TPR) repeat protein
VGLSLNNLAEFYRFQGKYVEAEPLYKGSLAISEKALGPEHPNVALSLENYAALLRKTNRNGEAAKMEARAKAIRAKHASENPTK